MSLVGKSANQDSATCLPDTAGSKYLVVSGFLWASISFYGVIVIVALWIAILLTILCFFKIFKVARALLLPYILWVNFATALNVSLWILNP